MQRPPAPHVRAISNLIAPSVTAPGLFWSSFTDVPRRTTRRFLFDPGYLGQDASAVGQYLQSLSRASCRPRYCTILAFSFSRSLCALCSVAILPAPESIAAECSVSRPHSSSFADQGASTNATGTGRIEAGPTKQVARRPTGPATGSVRGSGGRGTSVRWARSVPSHCKREVLFCKFKKSFHLSNRLDQGQLERLWKGGIIAEFLQDSVTNLPETRRIDTHRT